MEEEKDINDPRPEWIRIVSRYNKPDPVKSWWQLINSVGGYIILWILAIESLKISFWLSLLFSVLAAGFMVRVFIIFHDCGHGSFFISARLNKIVGIITGIIVFTPYHKWHYEHKVHHETVGNLDKRGIGDVMTLTVNEYSHLSKWKRFSYRFYRNPLFLLVIAPMLIFTILHRLTVNYMSARQKLYVHLSSIAVAGLITAIILLSGWKDYLLVQLPLLFVATVTGVWLFYVQHQYRYVQWTTSENWDYKTIALTGSSMYKLPALLNWFTGNIGYHHIHHLSPLIPNYNLKRCQNENLLFREVKPLTFFSSLESIKLRLWDEKRQMLVGFREL